MKRKEKALAESISSAVEAKVINTDEPSKKLKKVIDKSADKLAKKLTKLLKKEAKRASSDSAAKTKKPTYASNQKSQGSPHRSVT